MSVSLPNPEQQSAGLSFLSPEEPAHDAGSVIGRVRLIKGWGSRTAMVLLAVAVAFFTRAALARGHTAYAPFLTFYPAVLIAALLDGAGAGILVTLLSALVVEVWEMAPTGRWLIHDTSEIVGIAIFTVFGISVSIIVEVLHRVREKLARTELDLAVQAERHKTEQERQIAELLAVERKRLTDVLETLPSMVSLIDANHRVLFANTALQKRFGEAVGRPCFETRFGRMQPCRHCESFVPLQTGKPHRWEIALADGTFLDAYAYPFRDIDGASVILEVCVDITEHRRAQIELGAHRERLEELVRERTVQLERANANLEDDIAQLEQAQMRIAASEAKLKAALSSMTESVIIVDTEGNFIDFNDAFAALDGPPRSPATVRSIADFHQRFDVILASGKKASYEDLAFVRALRGERIENEEYTLRNRATGQAWIRSISFGPIRNRRGSITGAVITGRDITAAKKSEARLRRFYESELLAILYWKIDGSVIDANDRFLAMTGYTREDLLAGSINWTHMTPPEFQAQDEEAHRQINANGMHLPYEKQLIRKDGSRVWGHFWAAAYEDDRTEGVSFILDITERKRAEAELAEAMQQAERNTAQLRTIFDGMEERVYVCDIEGNVIVANDVARHSYQREGSSDAPPVYEMPRYFDVYTLDGRLLDPSEWPIHRALRGERFYGVEISIHFKHSNQVRILSSSGAPVRDKSGNIVMAVLTSADITNKKHAEEELRRKEARLRMALDAARSGAWEWDRETRIAKWSDELWGLFGLPAGAVEATFDNWLSFVHPEDRAEVERCFNAACEAGAEVDLTYRIVRNDGEVRWMTVRGSPILDNELLARSYIGIASDITERMNAETAVRESEKIIQQRQQLQALAERLRKAREEERTRVSRDLHDQIGQILTAIKMDLMWVDKRAPNSEIRQRLKRSIDLVAEGVQSVRTICSGLRPRVLDDLGLSAAIEWQANEFSARTGIPCQISVPAVDLPLGEDQTTAFFRIFQECLTNVSRYAEASRVEVCLFTTENELVMEIEDNGVGFTESAATGSLGILGMKERATACGGELQVQSTPGHGTTVSVRIPWNSTSEAGGDYARVDS